ncbi:MAG: hypothetical protein RR342_01415 [Bacilli bacterium]
MEEKFNFGDAIFVIVGDDKLHQYIEEYIVDEIAIRPDGKFYVDKFTCSDRVYINIESNKIFRTREEANKYMEEN